MDNKKNDKYFLGKIISDTRFLIEHTCDLTEESIGVNEVLLDSIMFRLIQISENSQKLTEAFRASNSHIPWFAIRGLRNRIVHAYGDVDLGVIYDTVKNDIPKLYSKLLELI